MCFDNLLFKHRTRKIAVFVMVAGIGSTINIPNSIERFPRLLGNFIPTQIVLNDALNVYSVTISILQN